MSDDGLQCPPPALSGKTAVILAMIAEGRSYDEILQAYGGLTRADIAAAAAEALRFAEQTCRGDREPAEVSSVDDVRRRHPREYEEWTPEEERQLGDLVRTGHTVAQIAGRLGRQRSAIRGRIAGLGLFDLLGVKEQQRFMRIEQKDASNAERPESVQRDG